MNHYRLRYEPVAYSLLYRGEKQFVWCSGKLHPWVIIVSLKKVCAIALTYMQIRGINQCQ